MYKLHHDYNCTDILLPDSLHSDAISVVEVGHSSPPAGYSSLKNKRDVYVLHYVYQGKGSFLGMPLEAPCGFLMTPEELQYYSVSSEPDAPQWEQYWIMFKGNNVKEFLANAGFSLSPHIFKVNNIKREWGVFDDLFRTENYLEINDSLYMLSVLFDIFSLHAVNEPISGESVPSYSSYVRGALAYIKDFYILNLCENDIAKAVHISTKYLHKLFKEEVGMPPMKYLNSYRISCARKLLLNSRLPISQVAAHVGFNDANYFCRVFQRFNNGVSPLQYRKSLPKSGEKENKNV